jgi:hypothetical protein
MLLAFESSCDETSVAVVSDGVVLSNVVATQIRMHSEYGGVVPELAVREHLKNLKPVCTEALRLAGVGVEDLRAVGATRGPGLPAAGQVWNYSYGSPNNCWLILKGAVSEGVVCGSDSPSTRTIAVTDPAVHSTPQF